MTSIKARQRRQSGLALHDRILSQGENALIERVFAGLSISHNHIKRGARGTKVVAKDNFRISLISWVRGLGIQPGELKDQYPEGIKRISKTIAEEGTNFAKKSVTTHSPRVETISRRTNSNTFGWCAVLAQIASYEDEVTLDKFRAEPSSFGEHYKPWLIFHWEDLLMLFIQRDGVRPFDVVQRLLVGARNAGRLEDDVLQMLARGMTLGDAASALDNGIDMDFITASIEPVDRGSRDWWTEALAV